MLEDGLSLDAMLPRLTAYLQQVNELEAHRAQGVIKRLGEVREAEQVAVSVNRAAMIQRWVVCVGVCSILW